jgi:hypothetical protein
MSTAENTARLNVACREILELLAKYLKDHELERLNLLIESKEQESKVEYLDLVYGFRKSLAFLDHEVYLEKLTTAWNLLDNGFNIEVKTINKKLKLLQADSKCDPEVMRKLVEARTSIEQKKAQIKIIAMELQTEVRVPFKYFIEDPKFDAVAWHLEHNTQKESWISKAMGRFGASI